MNIMKKKSATGDQWSENFRGQFLNGEKCGWGLFARPVDGISMKTCWKKDKFKGNKHAKVFDKFGNVIVIGKTRKSIGRSMKLELSRTYDGLIGCFYNVESGVLQYVGKICYKTMKEHEFGVGVTKIDAGWRCVFGLWDNGVMKRSMTSTEIGALKKEFSEKGIIFGCESL